MATGRKITLKNDDNEWLIPKTIASNVVAIISKDDEGNTSFVYQDSVNSTLAQAKMDKGETGKDADGKPIYFNKTGKDLDDSIQGIIDGVTPPKKAEIATYLHYDNPDEGKEDKINYEGLMGKVDTKATEAISKVTDEIYATVDNKIKAVETKSIQLAKTEKDGEGRVRLATESDMLNEQIVDDEGYYGNEPNAVAVTPYVLKRYLFGGEYISGVVGAANGVASLDEYGKLPSSQMPDGIDAIIEYATYDDFPASGEGGKIYVDLSTGKSYRWGGTTYVEISKSLALGETTGTAYEGSKGAANAAAISKILNGETTVPKATNATNADSATTLGASSYWEEDLNTFVPAVGKVGYYSIIPNTATNIPDPAGYQNSVMSFGLHDNGATAQMFFAKDKPLYYRSSHTGGWQQIATTADIDNIEIGGRNLVVNSSTPISSTDHFIGNLSLYENLIENSVYTITIWGELGAGRTSFSLYPERGMGGVLCELQQVSNGVYNATFIYHKGNATNSNAVGLYQVPSTSTSTSTIERIKIEKGNKATDWSPALEDEVAWRKIVGLNYVVTGDPIEY